MKKRLTAFFLCLAMCISGLTLAGCSKKTAENEIYFLNFKPESASVYKAIAYDYEQETGVRVKVVTAAANTYEQTLKSDIAKSDAPTIFQINGPIGYQSWKDYGLDLSDSKLYSYLTDKSMAITDNGGVYGIPYVVEGYGIIYNDSIMRKYFSMPDKQVSISSASEITDFATLKAVVEDMTSKKEALGIDGVFGSTSLSSGEDWRWQTHLANVPFYYEFIAKAADKDPVLTGLETKEIDFQFADNFKNLFDLYLNNSVIDKKLLGSKSVADSMAEFALGKCAMIQNGNWGWSQIAEVAGNTVEADDVKFLPLYTGVEGEANQGLCIGTENYLAINKQVSEEKQKLSLDFLDWLFSSDAGKQYVTDKLGFITPFNTFTEQQQPDDPLAREVASWMKKEDIKTIPWIFTAFPSENFKVTFGNALLEYAQGTKSWDEVVTTVKTTWKNER